jgi:hypothetical protein
MWHGLTTRPRMPLFPHGTAANASPGRIPASGRRGSASAKGGLVERASVRAYWNRVVVHQGWLTKKGGMSKKWLRRYFVLYKTCMGHILAYYSDYTETALFSDTAKERNVIDCCKVRSPFYQP